MSSRKSGIGRALESRKSEIGRALRALNGKWERPPRLRFFAVPISHSPFPISVFASPQRHPTASTFPHTAHQIRSGT